ncbi:hypothetical protein BS47DRAFT_1347128 [Hydnum rufescens UP504]|uniref:DUF6534 domain-containing protein n=1 Tax=Hydnum rufescens UP504 TaxID=1448309 RepID=A0A9P6DTZ0_9AGAM|nr:hypothetical protein BS47DRAFT_1347128 [Hydnum rufescens UP504]
METVKVTPVDILGGSFFGNLLTALCFGVLTIQTYSYYRAFPNDGKPVKLATYFCPTLRTLYSACCTQALYWWFITNYHNPSALGWSTWEFSTYQINTVCASVTVQTFFAHRVYSLSANLYVGVFVQVLVLLQNTNLEFRVIVKECTWLFVSWLTIQATADVVITTCMCLLLRRRRTGFQKTDSVINRMVLYTIGTGLITSVLSFFLLVMFAKYGFHLSVITIGMVRYSIFRPPAEHISIQD